MEKKFIEYYTKQVYGQTLEYIKNEGDAKIVQQLTGKKTINGVVRELIHDLSGGRVLFIRISNPVW